MQDEIAGLVAQNLELKLGIKKDRPAPNPEAYQLYLEAVRLWGMRNVASLDRAEQLLKRAIALQPDFARAYAAMGFVLSVTFSRAWHMIRCRAKVGRSTNRRCSGLNVHSLWIPTWRKATRPKATSWKTSAVGRNARKLTGVASNSIRISPPVTSGTRATSPRKVTLTRRWLK